MSVNGMQRLIDAGAIGLYRGLRIDVSDRVPLHSIYGPTGAVMGDVACMHIGGRLVFHPQRLAELQAAIARPLPTGAEFARWADDGGAQP